MESNVKLRQLFHHSRLPDGLALFFFPFYVPLGLIVMVIRLFLALQLFLVLSILPKRWLIRRILLRVSGSLIGIFVTQDGLDLYHRQKYKIIVTNHITHLDNLAFESLLPCVMNQGKVQTPALLRRILKYDVIPGQEFPALVFPEESNTSGTKGLLKFSSWPFDVKNEPFLLALLTVSRPYFVQIAPSVLGSSWWSDFLWLLFSPYTHFRIRFRKPPERKDGLTNEEYSIINQKFIATQLGIIATKFDAKEKEEFEKRLLLEHGEMISEAATNHTPTVVPKVRQTIPNTGRSPSVRQKAQLESMAARVKDVLPQVSVTVIQDDLRKTRCIDTTISNILEGNVPYTEDPPPQRSQPKINAESGGLAKVAAKSFGQSSSERHLSFQERKQAFIETARQRYIEKHGL